MRAVMTGIASLGKGARCEVGPLEAKLGLNEQEPVVQRAKACEPDREVCCVAAVVETAVIR